MNFQARQGDIFFEAVSPVATNKLRPKSDGVIAYGEVTGHAHVIVSPSLRDIQSYFDNNGNIVVKSHKTIEVAHDEHGTIALPPGQTYLISRQREYDPQNAERERLVSD